MCLLTLAALVRAELWDKYWKMNFALENSTLHNQLFIYGFLFIYFILFNFITICMRKVCALLIAIQFAHAQLCSYKYD